MSKRATISIILISVVGMTVGCQQPSMAEMMKQPPRPAELDQLEPFVGTWRGTGEMTSPNSDEVMKTTGFSRAYWIADEHLLVEEFEYGMENGETMKGIAVTMYDAKAGKFRSYMFDDWGTVGIGTMQYDADEDEWESKGKSHDYTHGGTTSWEGEMRLIGADKMEWSHEGYVGLIPMKVYEITGVSERE